MIDLDWLSERLCEALTWQLTNPDKRDDPTAPEVPFAGQRIWGIFLAVNATRGSNGFGPSPIAYAEIAAFSRLYREPIRPWELTILRELDATFLKAVAKRGSTETPAAPEVDARPLSPALFATLFAK